MDDLKPLPKATVLTLRRQYRRLDQLKRAVLGREKAKTNVIALHVSNCHYAFGPKFAPTPRNRRR